MSKDSKPTPILKVCDYVYIGPASHVLTNSPEFIEKKISVIINCASEIKHTVPIKTFHYRITDDRDATLEDYGDEVAIVINKAIENKLNLYIHSAESNSRAPALIIYWLMFHKKFFYTVETNTYDFDEEGFRFTYDNGLDFITNLNPLVSLNNNFERELLALEVE